MKKGIWIVAIIVALVVSAMPADAGHRSSSATRNNGASTKDLVFAGAAVGAIAYGVAWMNGTKVSVVNATEDSTSFSVLVDGKDKGSLGPAGTWRRSWEYRARERVIVLRPKTGSPVVLPMSAVVPFDVGRSWTFVIHGSRALGYHAQFVQPAPPELPGYRHREGAEYSPYGYGRYGSSHRSAGNRSCRRASGPCRGY